MSRRHSAEKREVLPDPKFGDQVLSRFMNVLMYDGKKSVAENIVYGAMDTLKRRGGANSDPLRLFHEAMENVKPAIEVRSRRVGGATYQVPVEVRWPPVRPRHSSSTPDRRRRDPTRPICSSGSRTPRSATTTAVAASPACRSRCCPGRRPVGSTCA